MTIIVPSRWRVVLVSAIVGVCIAATVLGLMPAMGSRIDAAMRGLSTTSRLVVDECWFEGDFPVACAWLWPTRQNAAEDTALLVVIVQRNAGRHSPQASIYLSGGPGGASYLFEEGIEGWIAWRDELGLDHDLVLYDPRGVGYSYPTIECAGYEDAVRAMLVASTDSAAQMAEQWTAMEQVVRRCVQRIPAVDREAGLLSTPTYAQDLLELVRALRDRHGYEHVVLYGASYGSRLAAATAALAAKSPHDPIDRIVLDAYYPAATDLNARAPLTWSEVLDDYAAYCAAESLPSANAKAIVPRCDGEALRARVHAILQLAPDAAQVREVMLDEGTVDGTTTVPIRVDRYYTIDMLMHALSANLDVDQLPQRAQEAVDGRWTPAWDALATSYIGGQLDWSFSPVAFNAVECADNGEVDEKATLDMLAANGEFAGVLSFVPTSRGYCERLGVRLEPLARERVDTDVLVTSMRLDPITPWRAARAALADLPRAHWRLVEGAGHGAADSDACAGRAIGAYMNSGDLSAWKGCAVIEAVDP